MYLFEGSHVRPPHALREMSRQARHDRYLKIRVNPYYLRVNPYYLCYLWFPPINYHLTSHEPDYRKRLAGPDGRSCLLP